MTTPDPLRYFRVEARDLTEQIGRDVLRLEAAAAPELVPRLLRLVHTLKGAARVVKQNEIADAAHTLEEALSRLRDSTEAASADYVDSVLRQVDGIAARVAALSSAESAAQLAGEGGVALIPILSRADAAELDGLNDALGQAGRQLRGLRGRVSDAVEQAVEYAAREIAAASDAAAKLRLMPASSGFGAVERTVRDVARAFGKEAAFVASGGDIRLDAEALTIVRRALIQLARNAVAHGIEPAAERTRLGKPASGRVSLDIVQRGHRIGFVCADDGAGIDLDAVRRVARERGVAAEALEQLTAGDLVQLLLRGGISTAAQASQMAGRGVGLDIVREAAERLGGEVRVESRQGQGTRVELNIPASRSTLEVLLMECGGGIVALPVQAVRRVIRLESGATGAAEGAVIDDGAVLPRASLARLLWRPEAPSRRALIVVDGASAAAIGVDRLAGAATLVVQPLPPAARADPLVASAALDADGRPVLILDPARLIAAAATAPPPVAAVAAPSKAPILVIDDSLTTRMMEQSILESAGFEVDLAVSAEDGLGMAAGRRYGLFLVDVEMPGMDGFTFVAQTRADPKFRATPALLVSSRGSDEDRRRAQVAGAGGYIVKGEFDQSRFLDTVRRLAS